jgi:hypothetical protein
VRKPKSETKVQHTLIRREDSERVASVGPLEIFRGSNLVLCEGNKPRVQAFYTVAVNKYWLQEGGDVELCIDADVRIVGTEEPLEEDQDLIVRVIGDRGGQYSVLVMDSKGAMNSQLELESVNVIDVDEVRPNRKVFSQIPED